MTRSAFVPNPSAPGGRRAVSVTDRALRYRANAQRPAGPELCHYCGATGGRIDVEHVDGKEEHSNPENLALSCRSCNTRKGLVFRRAKIGRPTKQYNPSGAKSLASWRAAADTLTGRRKAMRLADAIALVQATPPERRARFAQAMNPEPPTYEQYVRAVKMHTPGAHDEGGAVIHATPPALRSEYARRIAAFTAPKRRESRAAAQSAERARWD